MSRNARLKLLLVLLGLGSGCLLVEIGLQLDYRYTSGVWLFWHNPFMVDYYEPVRDRRHYTLRAGWQDRKQHITINDWRFRGPVVPPEPETVMVALGDSVPFGLGVGDDQSYPAVLNELFVEHGIPWRVVDAGAPTYNLRQSFDRLRKEVLPHYPHPALVTLHAVNDISLLTYWREAYTPDVTWFIPGQETSIFHDPRIVKCAIAYYLNHAISDFRKRKGWYRPVRHLAYPADKMIENVKQVLDENLAYCHARGIRLVLIPANPFYYQTVHQERNQDMALWQSNETLIQRWANLVDQYNHVLEDAAQGRAGVYFLDPRPVMDAQDRQALYVDFFHYTPAGNRVMGQILFDFLQKNHLIGLRSSQ